MNVTTSPKIMDIRRLADLPPLAWLVDVVGTPRVVCGRDVEVSETSLVEGCWDGTFCETNFHEAQNFFGSGYRILLDGMLFATATHTLDALYVLFGKDYRLVSNSLPLILTYANVAPDAKYNFCEPLVTVIDGLCAYERNIWTADGWRLLRLVHTNFVLTVDGVTELPKASCPTFPNLDAYISYLIGKLSACLNNASDPLRHRQYTPLTSCSSGYDSNAVAVLATGLGCKRAVTLSTARAREALRSFFPTLPERRYGATIPDSGASVARILGLECIEHRRPEQATAPESEIEFLASGVGGGGCYVLGVFEGELRGTVFLTGFHGDIIWGKRALPSPDLIRGDDSGCDLSEFRLRVGFLHIPVPFIGGTRAEDIWSISKSQDLAPYAVGGDYDRPICRRLLEEAGVPRELFGMKKKAITIGFVWSPRFLHEISRMSFSASVRDRRLRLSLLWDRMLFPAGQFFWKLFRKAEKADQILLGGRLRIGQTKATRSLKRRLRRRHLGVTTYANLLFLWALDISIEKYRRALTSVMTQEHFD